MSHIFYKIDFLQFQNPSDAASKVLSNADNAPTIFLECSFEANDDPIKWLSNLNQVVNCIRQQSPNCKLFFLAEIWWKYFDNEVRQLEFNDVLYTDNCLYRCYHEIVIEHCSSVVYRWPKDSKKFLFLTGRATGVNRIRLLHKLEQHNLLEQCEWSLHLPDDNDILERAVHKSVPEMSTSEFRKFVDKYKRSPDNLNMNPVGNAISSNGLQYDIGLYLDTCFSVVPETSFKNTQHPFLTEKIWKPIINKHPFIFAGDTHSLEYLNSLGFVTFEQYLPVRDYANISDSEQRLNAVVENTKYLINNIHKHQDKIAAAVKHNSTVIDELYKSIRDNIQNFITKNNLQLTVKDLIDTKNLRPMLYTTDDEQQLIDDANFVMFYNGIKSDTWPDVCLERDFHTLPEHIQLECQRVFGYVPK